MKKTFQDYLKIGLTLLIIVGMFMPYIYGVLPLDVLFENLNDMESLFGLTIPVLIVVPFLLILLFKDLLKDSILRILKPIFLILYVIILIDYCYGIYNSYGSWLFDESLEFTISIVISLILIILTSIFAMSKLDTLENILLSILGLPIILYLAFGITNDIGEINYGGYIISGSFMILYVMAIYKIYKNRKANQIK